MKTTTKGVTLVRVRDNGLGPLSEHDILLSSKETRDGGIFVVKRLLESVQNAVNLGAEDDQRVSKYLSRKKLANNKEFTRLLSHLPGPPPNKSLAHNHPVLFEEWHTEKNSPLTPEMFTPGSGTKVWWVCSSGHEWEAVIRIRVKGHGCPYCAGQRALPDHNLVVKYPDLLKQWYPTKNQDVDPQSLTPGSNKKAWWLCEEGRGVPVAPIAGSKKDAKASDLLIRAFTTTNCAAS